MSIRAFSLIELMVVVAIIGVLAVVAVPAYKSYSNKAKVASVIATLEIFSDYLNAEFDAGRLTNAPVKWSNFTFTDNTTTNVAAAGFNNFSLIQYFGPGGYLGADTWMVCGFVTGLSGAPANSGGTAYNDATNSANRVCIRTRVGVPPATSKPYCGVYNNGQAGSPSDMSPELLPPSCQCLFLVNYSGCT